MFIVIYEKVTKRIVRIIEDGSCVSYGYSENCAEAHMEQKPEGKFLK